MNKIAGRYEIKSKLGEGGMGVVFRAYDTAPKMDREVAVKTLHEFSDPFARELFYKECSALKSFSHPNVVEIFDMGEYEDAGHQRPFFVMPLLPGQTLDQLIKTASHRLTVDRVVEIFTQTCRGLQAAHERGLVHRDLKPSNIFVMSDDSVKIIDFGVAHSANERSRSGYDKGTLLYMAPEQVQHKPVSVQSDIYALGVTLYEALTRRQPFRLTGEESVVRAILNLIPPPASDLNPSVSHVISRVVHKAMAKQPWHRFDSAREFGETLQKAHRNEPIAFFDAARTQPRIQTATKALEKGDYQFAGEILSELEAEGNIDPQITMLRAQIDQTARQKTVAQLLDSARARFEEEEDPLALQKLQEVLQLDPTNVGALSLKGKIDDRRSERQIEKWIQLAQQHATNRSYEHAREALRNALGLRPKDSRATRLLKEVETEEQDYVRLRQEKTELYRAAVNAWQNGEVSQALSQMKLVLDLDRRAPDTSSPDAAGTYQSFYNKIRSEHDAMNTGYADARRHLADKEYADALAICESFLAKYPGQALFQALKFDIEEQQRQRLSSFIADVDHRLEAESDLDVKLSIVREAAAEFPDEDHFRRLGKPLQDKRDLVNSIVERARLHESAGQITEALSDLETLRTIYAAYAGLKFERERLQKRLEQQTRDLARAKWVRQIDGQLHNGDHAKAIELLDKAELEFPADAELSELRKLAMQGVDRMLRADQLAAEGQQLCEQGQFDAGVELMRSALQLDDRNGLRLQLRDLLVAHAQQLFETDWRAADQIVGQALELDPNHSLAKSLRARALDRQREETVPHAVSVARRLQAEGKLDEAMSEVERGLRTYPGDSRLLLIAGSLGKEIARLAPAAPPAGEEKTVIKSPTPFPVPHSNSTTGPSAPTPPPKQTPPPLPTPREPIQQDAGGETIVLPRGDVFEREHVDPIVAERKPVSPAEHPAPGWISGTRMAIAAGVVLLAVTAWLFWPKGTPPPPSPTLAMFTLRDFPPDVKVYANGELLGTTAQGRDFEGKVNPGARTLTFERDGFDRAPISETFTAGQPTEIRDSPESWKGRGVVNQPVTTATLELIDWPVDTRVLIDDKQVGTVSSRTYTFASVQPGTRKLVFSRDNYEPEEEEAQFDAGSTVKIRAPKAWRKTTSTPTPTPSSSVRPGTPTATPTTASTATPTPTPTATPTPPPDKPADKPSAPAPPAPILVRFRAQKDVSVTVRSMDGTGTPRQFIGTGDVISVNLLPGPYSVESIGRAQVQARARLTVSAPGPMDFEVHHARAMEAFGDGAWKVNGNRFESILQPFTLTTAALTGGKVTFSVPIYSARGNENPFAPKGAKLSWVIGYQDERNYTLVEIDAKTLFVTQYVSGVPTGTSVRHNIGVADTGDRFLEMEIDLSGAGPVHRYRLIGRERPEEMRLLPQPDNLRSRSADGKFGFKPASSGQVVISAFLYQPASR